MVDMLDIDNTKVREAQIARLHQVRAERDDAAVQGRARGAHRGRRAARPTCWRSASTPPAPRATVGEISDAMEEVFGRHRAEIRSISGVYGSAYEGDEGYEAIQHDVEAFAAAEGRRPRMLVAKMGQDGHDRGAKVIATAFADIGFDVDVGPLFQTPAEVAARRRRERRARRGRVEPGRGPQDAGPATHRRAPQGRSAGDMLVVCGGVIPPQDYPFLEEAGVAAVFGPGTNIPEAAAKVLALLGSRHQPVD